MAKIVLKQYKQIQVETKAIEFVMPTETQYYFDEVERCDVKFTPVFTTHKRQQGLEEEFLHFDITYVSEVISCLKQCSINRYILPLNVIEAIYYSDDNRDKHWNFIKQLIHNTLLKIPQSRFEQKLKEAIKKLNSMPIETKAPVRTLIIYYDTTPSYCIVEGDYSRFNNIIVHVTQTGVEEEFMEFMFDEKGNHKHNFAKDISLIENKNWDKVAVCSIFLM